jgi:selenocysteine-specific elongation factor
LTPEQAAAWEKARERLVADLAVPQEDDLSLDPEVVHLKLRDGELVRVGPGLVYLPEQIETLRSKMASLEDGFTVAQFRDAAGLSRKYAVPFLEWADKEGLTVRRGDIRRIR